MTIILMQSFGHLFDRVVYLHMDIHSHTNVDTHACHAHTRTHHVCIHAPYIHTHTHAHIHTHIYACTHAAYIHTCVCICILHTTVTILDLSICTKMLLGESLQNKLLPVYNHVIYSHLYHR